MKRIKPASVGIYFYIYREPQWLVRQQLSMISLSIPGAPVYISSDGGDDYSAVCTEYSNYAKKHLSSRTVEETSHRTDLCHFKQEPENMHFGAPGNSHVSWQKQGRAHEWCEAWTQRVETGLLWLNSTWTVYHEGDNLILNHPLEVDSRADVFVLSNVRVDLPQEMARHMQSRCGHSAVDDDGILTAHRLRHSGGLMFRSAAWLRARDAIMLNRSLWNIYTPVTDTCTAAMLQANCAVEVPSPGFLQLGGTIWKAMGEPHSWSRWFRHYRTWPHGIDLSECLTCLRPCQQAHCMSEEINAVGTGEPSAAVSCVARKHCPCPSIMHSIHKGLCDGPGEGFRAMVDDDWDAYFLKTDTPKLLVCLTRGLCAPSASSQFRLTSAVVHGILVSVTTMSWVRHARRPRHHSGSSVYPD